MNKYSFIKIIIISATLFFFGKQLRAEPVDTISLSIKRIFDMVEETNRQIKLSSDLVRRTELVVDDKQNNKLPDINFSASVGYLSNVGVIGLNTLPSGFYKMPHITNSFALQASLLLFAGERLTTDVDMARINKGLAAIVKEKNVQAIKLVLAGSYLDLYQLYQQKKVYEKNIILGKELLRRIQDRYKTGVALKSDKIRNELLLSNFELELSKVNDRIQIINNNIIASLSLPDNAVVIPETKIEIPPEVDKILLAETDNNYSKQALDSSPEKKEVDTKVRVAEKSLKLVKSSYYPEISLFLSGALARPYTFDIPAKDIYANNNSVGVRLNFPIDNLYQSRKKVDIANNDIAMAEHAKELLEQNLKRDVKNSIINAKQAYNQLHVIEKQQELADENYRRITDGYMEQLVLNTEVMDASNQKLDADLKMSSAKVQIIYTYYQLLKTLGQL